MIGDIEDSTGSIDSKGDLWLFMSGVKHGVRGISIVVMGVDIVVLNRCE